MDVAGGFGTLVELGRSSTLRSLGSCLPITSFRLSVGFISGPSYSLGVAVILRPPWGRTVSSLLLRYTSYLPSKEAVVFRLKVWIRSRECSSSEVQVRWNLRFEAWAEPLRELSLALL